MLSLADEKVKKYGNRHIQCCGSGSGPRRAKMTQKNSEVNKFHLLKCWMFSHFEGWRLLLRLGLDVFEGLGIRKLQYLIKKRSQKFSAIFFQFLVRSGSLDHRSGFTWNAGSVSRSRFNESGSTTLVLSTPFRYVTISSVLLTSVEPVRAVWQPARWLSGGQLSLRRQRLTHICRCDRKFANLVPVVSQGLNKHLFFPFHKASGNSPSFCVRF